MKQSVHTLLHNLHKFARLSLGLSVALCVWICLLALGCFFVAPYAADYFAVLRLAEEAMAVAPALLGCGVLMAAIGQLVLGRQEQ